MTDEREGRLLSVAALFLFLYAAIVTVAPAVRGHTWAVPFRYSQWAGYAAWLAGVFIARRFVARRLPDRDPYLLPLAALLSGWGLLTIWRLQPGLGARQAIWLLLSLAAFVAIPYASNDLGFLRRYKYILLAGGLLLTALTLLLGTNPSGYGPRLWLGCCGLYLQPSEPLKLLLVVYLSAYLADRLPLRLRFFPLLVPTLFLTGVALLLLVVQRDLGTASIFILLYTTVLFIATNRRRVLLAAAAALLLAGLVGFFFIDVVHARLESWINPWSDPSGRSYQIVQSLLAIANGGTFGRGPGIGNPGLVPVAHSDFVFAAIGEESGLAGSLALLGTFGLLLSRGFLTALRAPDRFRRLLVIGATAYLGLQALVIIGGNLRLLPLTGVTLPFVSYGGSSLMTSFIAISLITAVSNLAEQEPAPLASLRPFVLLGLVLAGGILAAGLGDAWWSVVRAPELLARTDNPRRAIADLYVPRGSILDRNNEPIDRTSGSSGNYQRDYLYPPLAPVTGYTHRVFGQGGLESSLDGYLRGTQGNPSSLVLWDSLLYGTPPPGLDVRLSIDLQLQRTADDLLGQAKGAVVLINAQTGEVLTMASHPGYDPNQLDAIGALLYKDTDAPLLNRAAQGTYPPGTILSPFDMSVAQANAISISSLYKELGLYTVPDLRMAVAKASVADDLSALRITPLQMALAASVLSNGGVLPAARIALAVDTPQAGWIVLPALERSHAAMPANVANRIANQLAVPDRPYWRWGGAAQSSQEADTWFIAGTLPGWKAVPLAVAVLLEESEPMTAQRIGQALIQAAMKP
ncbi:MAG TPA: FtsW/RodA/SpoVE family cell cycle protein [Anaerolineales bacterium]